MKFDPMGPEDGVLEHPPAKLPEVDDFDAEKRPCAAIEWNPGDLDGIVIESRGGVSIEVMSLFDHQGGFYDLVPVQVRELVLTQLGRA